MSRCAPRSCEICGSTYRPTYSAQQTCGRECGVKLRRLAPLARRCETCGNDFTDRYAGFGGRYCSDACRPSGSRPLAARECAECRHQFTPNAKTQKYCSKDCAKAGNLEQCRVRNSTRACAQWDRSPRACKKCEVLFDPALPHQKYCSYRCRKSAGVRDAGKHHRSRARHFGRQYEPVNPLTIFERDRWICQLCGKRVPKARKAPHPRSATLDHIIPMSEPGGDHVPSNLQIAHFECNWRRGTGGTVQLLLVG